MRNVFLDSFKEGVNRYSAKGKPICLLGDVNINTFRAQTYRATPTELCLFSRQLINQKECTVVRQHLWTMFLQIRSANTLPEGTLFLTSLITFPNSASFNVLLKQLSLSKLEFKTTQNTLSRYTKIWFVNRVDNVN